ncbi:MAG: hotdog fold thioesterase [Flavobacteriales bacterium]|jgi:acyl-CoA thioesterase
MKTPDEIVELMLTNDQFSNWLGLEVIHLEKGKVNLKTTVKEEMLNGFEIAHGGIAYALGDSALAFSANAHGKQAVSVETSISHVQKVFLHDVLTTEVNEVSLNHKIGIYHIRVINQYDVEVAHFKGTVYISVKEW